MSANWSKAPYATRRKPKTDSIRKAIDPKYIGIDCAPGYPRPDSLLPGVLEGTGLTLGDPVSKLFGAWEWEIPLDQTNAWNKAQATIVKRLNTLYDTGRIRGAIFSKGE